VNTGFGFATDNGFAGLGTTDNSGFFNEGGGISGFGNKFSSGSFESGGSSGFFNKATGGSIISGTISGFFNTGETGAIGAFPSGLFSGFTSGIANTGIGIPGLFSLALLAIHGG
jgi:hypothetical protein